MDDLIRQLLQLAASLAAILALAWLAGRLRLGGDIRITDADHARRLADEVLSGFDPVDIVVDRSGYGALLRDEKGRIMLLRQHGVHFAGRVMHQRPEARLDQGSLTIYPDDKPFGPVTLNLGSEAQIWAASFRRMERQAHA